MRTKFQLDAINADKVVGDLRIKANEYFQKSIAVKTYKKKNRNEFAKKYNETIEKLWDRENEVIMEMS